MLKYFTVLIVCLFGVQAQVPVLTRCPSVDVEADFDLDRFVGTWYEARGYPHTYELNTKCVEQTFTKTSNESITLGISWTNTQSSEALSLEGTAEMFYPGYFSSDIAIPIGPIEGKTNAYWVLGTDYDNYAVVFSCQQEQILFTFFGYENLWILTRERNPSDEVLENALNDPFTRNTYLNKWLLSTSIQTDC